MWMIKRSWELLSQWQGYQNWHWFSCWDWLWTERLIQPTGFVTHEKAKQSFQEQEQPSTHAQELGVRRYKRQEKLSFKALQGSVRSCLGLIGQSAGFWADLLACKVNKPFEWIYFFPPPNWPDVLERQRCPYPFHRTTFQRSVTAVKSFRHLGVLLFPAFPFFCIPYNAKISYLLLLLLD